MQRTMAGYLAAQRGAFALLCLIVVCVAGCASTRVKQRAPQSYTFGLFGDLSYVPEREKQLDAVLADINCTPMAFVVHVGDLGGLRDGSCTDALWRRRFQQFRASVNPLIYTPGDNDWTDCHDEQGVKGGVPSERLAKLRALFFQGEETFGQRKFPFTRQTELRDAVAKEALAFVKPVALVHGDSHFFRVDKPFMIRRSRDVVVPNFTRIETFGAPNHHWVQVTVDPDDPNVFTVRPRMVAANINPL